MPGCGSPGDARHADRSARRFRRERISGTSPSMGNQSPSSGRQVRQIGRRRAAEGFRRGSAPGSARKLLIRQAAVGRERSSAHTRARARDSPTHRAGRPGPHQDELTRASNRPSRVCSRCRPMNGACAGFDPSVLRVRSLTMGAGRCRARPRGQRLRDISARCGRCAASFARHARTISVNLGPKGTVTPGTHELSDKRPSGVPETRFYIYALGTVSTSASSASRRSPGKPRRSFIASSMSSRSRRVPRGRD